LGPSNDRRKDRNGDSLRRAGKNGRNPSKSGVGSDLETSAGRVKSERKRFRSGYGSAKTLKERAGRAIEIPKGPPAKRLSSTRLYPKGRKGSRESHCLCRPSGYNLLHSPDPAAVVTVWSELPETIHADIVAMGWFRAKGAMQRGRVREQPPGLSERSRLR
jgi:hypothetical protein